MTIELPDWARIGNIIEVRDYALKRGDDSNHWYRERIISFGYNGVFHQAAYCPVYFTEFEEYGKTIRLPEDE